LAGVINAIIKGGFLDFLFILVGIELMLVVVWLFRSIIGWGFFLVIGKKTMAKSLFRYLKENNYPRPKEVEDTVHSYFKRIEKDESLPVELRLTAAREYASIGSYSEGRPQTAIKNCLAYELAIEEYTDSLPAEQK